MIKICDFGWSTICQEARQTFCGTPLYLSPELLLQQNYNTKIDIWSIGVLGFELLFGRVPFEIRNQSDFTKIINDEVIFPPHNVSEEAKSFLKGCLKKDPDARLSIGEVIEHSFM